MNTVLNFPEISDAPHATALAVPTIKDATLAPFTRTEAALRLVAEKWRAVVFAVDTAKGLADAKAARNELRESGRYAVQRAEKRVKDEVNDLKRAVADEAERLIAIVKPVEDAIDAQIAVREAVLAAEKAERDRIEAARVAKHRAGIETIRGYVAQAQGRTAAEIRAAIATLQGLRIGMEWQEFEVEAAGARGHTLTALTELHNATKVREEEAARIEAQRIEQARVAAEQAERQRHLNEQAAALKLQAEQLAASRAEAERLERRSAWLAKEALEAKEIAAAALAEQHRQQVALPAENTQVLISQQVLKAEAPAPDATDRENQASTSPVGGPMGAGQPAAAGPVVEVEIAANCVTDDERGTRLVGPHGGLKAAMPNPTEADLASSAFNAIWNATKTWDVNVPEFYQGYCGMNGSHVMLILNALRKIGERQQ